MTRPHPRPTIAVNMHFFDELRAEHDLIEAVAGSMRTFLSLRQRGEGDPADGPRFVRFLRLYAGHYHHAREENTLFAALVERAQLPERGPIAALVADHHHIAGLLDQIDLLVGRDALDGDAARQLESLAVDYSRALWRHIDAENSVLFPEGEARLRKASVRELPSRPPTEEEADARSLGEALTVRYPPLHDAVVMRGDGCVCCPAMGETCRGLELEWWNEWEWAEADDHIVSG
jgi:hemerythrin-like domain-containing protein